VVGVDSDEEAVVHAANNYRAANLEFRRGTLGRLPAKGGERFDVIVSFETIEHVDAREQALFAAEARRLLNAGGILIISTPDRKAYSDDLRQSNPFHLNEFYRDEFLDYLGRSFKHVHLLGQRVYAGSYLWPVTGPAAPLAEYHLAFSSGFRPSAEHGKEPKYLVAVCSNVPLVAPSGSVLVDVSDRTVPVVREQIQARELAVHDLGERVRTHEAAVVQGGNDLAVERARVLALEERVRHLEAELGRAEAEAAARGAAVEEAAIRLDESRASWRQGEEMSRRAALQVAELGRHVTQLAALMPGLGEVARAPYVNMVRRLRRVVRRSVPAGASILVISRGDNELLRIDGRRASHFPQACNGSYAGHHPADGAEAIAHLDALHRRGAEFLVIPATALWWLEHYVDFGNYLDRRYSRVADVADTCVVYALRHGATSGAE
jgi:hypothetical protein